MLSKVDQILAAITTNELQKTEVPTPQSLVERVKRLETRERMVVERMILRVEMVIRDLDNRRIAGHKDIMCKVEASIKEVTKLKDVLQKTLQTQETNSRKLIEETHTAYEVGYVVLQNTIKGLRRSLTTNQSVDEILRLTKEIYQLLFMSKTPNNQDVCDLMKNQFNDMFEKIEGLMQCFEEQLEPASLKGGSESDQNQE